MYKTTLLTVLSFALMTSLTGVSCSYAQEGNPKEPDTPLSAAARTEVIDGILKQLNSNYVFPETAKKMETSIRKRVQNGEYEKINSSRQFAQMLTTHLQEVSHDKHLRVRYSSETLPVQTGHEAPSAEEQERQMQFLRAVNFGFEKLERLPGNVGYIDMRMFASPDVAGPTCAAAMSFLADTDALILDLRQNGGGDPAMVALVCSYLFSGEQVHLNDLYFRPSDSTQQFWTLPYLPGKRYVNKEVYVLTSHNTFSGAEECTYNLKNLKRATIIGETTGGGAHPGGFQRITDHIGAFIPVGRAINPITKTNWEGTGVKPDVEAPAEKALKIAHLSALKKIVPKVTDAQRRERIQQLIADTEKELEAKK